MMDSTFDLPAFLLGKLYDNMDWDNGWTLSDAIALAEDIRRYDGIDCDPQEIYEILREFHEQDADVVSTVGLHGAGRHVWHIAHPAGRLPDTGAGGFGDVGLAVERLAHRCHRDPAFLRQIFQG